MGGLKRGICHRSVSQVEIANGGFITGNAGQHHGGGVQRERISRYECQHGNQDHCNFLFHLLPIIALFKRKM